MDKKNRMGMTIVAGLLLCVFLTGEGMAREISAEIEGDRVVVKIDGKLFTNYKFAARHKRPYFWPVVGPVSGQSVTVESTEPYPHHNSLFFGCDRVNGGNYWQDVNDRGQILSQGPEIEMASGEKIVFTDTCLWKQPGKEPVMRDRRRVTISAPSDELRFIDFEVTLIPLTDIVIQKTNHSLFSARLRPELSVESGGKLTNAEGEINAKGTFGVASPWCDYSGTRDGMTEGLAILQNPANRWYPSKWFTRDYGFMSPTPMYWPANGKNMTFARGETLTLRYRVVVHAGDVAQSGIANIFEAYRAAAGAFPLFAFDNYMMNGHYKQTQVRADTLKELGYDGMGSRGTALEEQTAIFEKAGLKIFATYLDLNLDAEQKYDGNLKKCIKQLKGKGTILWLTVTSKNYKPGSARGDAAAVKAVGEIADMARESGLKIALYPHVGMYVETFADSVRIARQVNRPNVGGSFNLCHFLKIQGDVDYRPILKESLRYLFLVSINGAETGDTKKMGWDKLIQTLDKGAFDNDKLLKTLKEIGYTGPVGLQGYAIQGDAKENLTASMKAWRKIDAGVRSFSPKR
ncbi:MAG: PmoA family protein [Phycisphaerae bacterium]|nr:PmoA family protein [Phycisphaerae bacterium]